MTAAVAMFAPEMLGMEAMLAATPEVMAGLGVADAAAAGAAGAAGAGAIAGGAIEPIAATADPYLMMRATPTMEGIYEQGAMLGTKDKMAAMIDKMGPKLAGQMGSQMLAGDDQRMPAPGSPRMNGQQSQPTPVQVDYGGAMPRKEAGASQMLGIDEQELKRLLMSLRGY